MNQESKFQHVIRHELQQQVFNEAVDFCNVFNVLSDLFRKLGVLDEGDDKNQHDISFRFSYPDFEYKDNYENLVLFDILDRKVSVSEGQFTSGMKQVKPIELNTSKDIKTGQVTTTEMRMYDNVIAFEVHSTSVQRLYQLVSYIETALIKHKGYLHKKLVYAPQYLGMSATQFSQNQHHNRMFSKTLTFKITTAEISLLTHEEIQLINKQII